MYIFATYAESRSTQEPKAIYTTFKIIRVVVDLMIFLHNTALNGDHLDYRKDLNTDYAPEYLFSDQYYPQIVKFLEDQHAQHGRFKFNFVLTVIYESPIVQETPDNEENFKTHDTYRKVPVASEWNEANLFQPIEPVVNNTLHQLLDKMTCHLQQGSGLVFRALLHLDINITKIKPNSCGSAKNVSQDCDMATAMNTIYRIFTKGNSKRKQTQF